MVGFLGGLRSLVNRADGFSEMVIACTAAPARDAWRKVIPESGPLQVRWFNEMTIWVGPSDHQIIFQDVSERDEWRRVFPQSPQVEHVAEWRGDVLKLGCRILLAAVTAGAPAPVNLSALSDVQLRTKAIELEIQFNPKKPPARGLLEQQITEKLAQLAEPPLVPV